MQVTMNEATCNYLQDTFVPHLQRAISTALDRVGKGWFNTHESNYSTYEFSKLKRLLMTVRLSMEDALRTLVLASLRTFRQFMLDACDVSVAVSAPDEVAVTRGPRAAVAPLLSLELQLSEEQQVVWSDDVTIIPDQIVSLMQRGVAATQGLAQLEPLVMTKLYWAHKPKLSSVMAAEEEVVEARQAVHGAWSRVVGFLEAYRGQFAQFSEVLERSNDAYVKELVARGEDLTLADVNGEIHRAEELLAKMKRIIPAKVCAAATWLCAFPGEARDFGCYIPEAAPLMMSLGKWRWSMRSEGVGLRKPDLWISYVQNV